mgnify:CR=1 FL=1|jgi:hypothetical protein|tara:strand:- start:582 stop:863 length:282 start_codon:yes stop_codon:yes gene_type:complete
MGKSKNKVVDLKPENISEEHLEKLQGIVQALNKLHYEMGVMEMKKLNISKTIGEGNDALQDFRKVLVEKYGKHDIDVSSGEIKYKSDDEPSDS